MSFGFKLKWAQKMSPFKRGMTKRQKSSLKFFTETEKIKHWNWKFFTVFFWKLKSVENTEKKTEKKLEKNFFFQDFMPKKLKNVNKTLETENFYWKLYLTENRFRIDV